MNLYLNFASYLGVALLLMVAGILLFIVSTPKVKEFSLIGEEKCHGRIIIRWENGRTGNRPRCCRRIFCFPS